ncbi:class I SAM-dependent methyltransferase [Salidesulfovibrio onnuriiensis]|uniref:class I SAM-dependent methyltransferase n=1 Tax=Salidesulfovibrio onnuriiensis TaxID=2583823 RepID=UPI0011C95A66|nr:class I SAM-dependent methyltransferase [Salidesulfovibrio onnuriiensis]
MNNKNAGMPFPPENIDWSLEWARTYAKSSITARRSSRPAFWDKRAKRFSAMDNGAAGRVEAILEKIGIDAETTILDIGCGPGNLAIPLAKQAKSVTALDPSAGMLEQLRENAHRQGVTNIRCINKDWDTALQDGDIAPHDLLLSSYSLLMEDLGESLRTMHSLARKAVCLFWFAGRECFGYDHFWPTLFGEEFIAGPDHTYLVNLLNSLRIYPDVSIIPQQHVTRYADMEDAVQCWTEALYISSADQQQLVREALDEMLGIHEGKPEFRRDVRSAMIWWRKDSLPA